jgi:hypothetical protein
MRISIGNHNRFLKDILRACPLGKCEDVLDVLGRFRGERSAKRLPTRSMSERHPIEAALPRAGGPACDSPAAMLTPWRRLRWTIVSTRSCSARTERLGFASTRARRFWAVTRPCRSRSPPQRERGYSESPVADPGNSVTIPSMRQGGLGILECSGARQCSASRRGGQVIWAGRCKPSFKHGRPTGVLRPRRACFAGPRRSRSALRLSPEQDRAVCGWFRRMPCADEESHWSCSYDSVAALWKR